MNQAATPDDLDGLDEIVIPGPLEHSGKIEGPIRTFKPWHLPRKQSVRRDQWGQPFSALLELLPSDGVVKYLCLPGEDLLDVDVLTSLCKDKGRNVRYLGFDMTQANATRSTQRVLSEQLVRQRGVVDAASEVIPDEFCSLATPNSRARRYLNDGGAYDVVNLDMCDAFTSIQGPTHDALKYLLDHQLQRRTDPWLLFLTTRSEWKKIAEEELSAYVKLIGSNAEQSSEFKDTVQQLTRAAGTSSGNLSEGLRESASSDPSMCGRMLALGIGKWLLGIASSPEAWRVDLLSVWCYRTGLSSAKRDTYAAEPPNLFSLVFKFEKLRTARPDPAGLSSSGANASSVTEGALALKMLKAILTHTKDIDCELQSDTSRLGQLLTESAGLLKRRNYDNEAYLAWVESHEQVKC